MALEATARLSACSRTCRGKEEGGCAQAICQLGAVPASQQSERRGGREEGNLMSCGTCAQAVDLKPHCKLRWGGREKQPLPAGRVSIGSQSLLQPQLVCTTRGRTLIRSAGTETIWPVAPAVSPIRSLGPRPTGWGASWGPDRRCCCWRRCHDFLKPSYTEIRVPARNERCNFGCMELPSGAVPCTLPYPGHGGQGIALGIHPPE